ncbi:unnamed protein product, partial [Clonostachys chloroleuca]
MHRGDHVGPQINDSPAAVEVQAAHVRYLTAALWDVALVDADGVDPDHPCSSPWPCRAQHFPAVFGLQKDVPEWADVDGLAQRAVFILAGPRV